jgi:hypothetical protein
MDRGLLVSALPDGEAIAFARLRKLLGAADGNLGTHLGTLENAGYVALGKGFVARKPQTANQCHTNALRPRRLRIPCRLSAKRHRFYNVTVSLRRPIRA